MASNVFFQKGSLFRAVQFFEKSGRNQGRVQQNLRLWVKYELFICYILYSPSGESPTVHRATHGV